MEEIRLDESLMEFFVSPEDSMSKYGITAENNWSNPNILPNRFDRTWDGWFKRIENWGKVNILHVDPEKKKREQIGKTRFMELMGTADLMKLYGKFRAEIIKINRCEFIREYIGIDGKMYKEIFQVKVDLKPELRKGLDWFQFVF